ncbi:uncharacterized protein B0H18DRAFT_1058858 [Fomitopsis serialis]|uniref:uncharacterized protein n=1 Tax=Fomitopsis serialis TaxID=139415 RepID=UPI002008DF6A|nr:uncharacterized protein B0H18DRAFT_1058858 [Neoantrodia serialis]KAH9911805.1 hypothetical protein B0H18DRAFT_1058858 [Neoantrodia serialis]
MPATFTCVDCGKDFRDASALESHSKSRKYGLDRQPSSCPHGIGNKGYDSADLSHILAQKNDRYKVDMPYDWSIVFVPASKAAVPSPTASNDAAVAGAAGATFGTAPATTSPSSDPPMECRCAICDLSFCSDDELNAHYKWSPIHPLCGKCGDYIQDKTELSRHMQVTHACDVCVCGATVKIDDLFVHYKSSSCHPKCSRCGIAFRDGTALLEHEKTRHVPQHCALCDLWFATMSDLQRHLHTCFLHPNCLECRMGFVGIVEYLEHLEAVHERAEMGEKAESKKKQKKKKKKHCDYCNITFAGKSGLKKHNYETPKHPRCIPCEKRFLRYDDYKNHMASKHPSAALLPRLLPRPSMGLSMPSSSAKAYESPKGGGYPDTELLVPGRGTVHVDAPTTVPCATTPELEAREEGILHTEPSAERQDLLTSEAKDVQSIAVARDLPEMVGAPPSSHNANLGCNTSNKTMSTSSVLTDSHRPDVEDDTESLMSPNTLSSTSTEADFIGQFHARPHLTKSTMQREASEEREEEAAADAYIHVDADEQSTDVYARAIYERPDSVISYVTETDIDVEDLSVSSSMRPPDSVVTHASSVSNASEDLDSTFSAARIAAEKLDPPENTGVPSVSTGRTRGSISSESRVSEEVSSVTASIATTGQSVPTPSNPAMSVPLRGSHVGPSWRCRSCGKDPCEDPTATQCGHIFCHSCIVKEIAENLQCPVCHKLFLLRLHAG